MMNRRIRRCIIGIVGVLMSLLMAGCSHKPTSLEIVSGMQNAIAQNSAILMDWQLDCNMNLEAKTEEIVHRTDVSLTMEGSTWGSFTEQLASTTGEIRLAWPGMELRENLEAYTQKNDQKITDYLKLRDTWVKNEKSSQSGDLAQLNILNMVQEFKDILVLSSETVTLEDKTCYEMKAILLPEDLMTVLSEYTDILNPYLETEDATGSLNRLDRYDLDQKSIQLALYVEEESYLPAGLSISLEERGIGKEDGADSESDSGEVIATWDETVDLTISDIKCEIANVHLTAVFGDGAADTPAIPQEALAAVDYALFLENREATGTEGDEDEAFADTLYREDGSWQLLDAYEEGSYPLMEGDNFRIDLIRVYENSEKGPCADLLLVNSGRADLDIYTRGVAVNRTMLPEASMYQHVPAGGEVRYTLQMPSALRYGIESLADMYLEFEVVDTVNIYVEDENSGVVIYRVGSTSVEMLHPEEAVEPAKEVDASAILTMSDEEFDALLEAKSLEKTAETENGAEGSEKLTGKSSEEESVSEKDASDAKDTVADEVSEKDSSAATVAGEALENPEADVPVSAKTSKKSDKKNKNSEEAEESGDPADADTMEEGEESSADSMEEAAGEADRMIADCKAEMTEKDTILLEDEHLLVIAKEPVVTDITYRIPVCLVNVSGKNITLDGKDFKNANGIGMKMTLNSVIFDGCRLNANLMLDLAIQESETRRTWGLGERTETSSAEATEMETEEIREETETVDEGSAEAETMETVAETVSEEEESAQAAEDEASRYLTFSMVAYILEDYPTAEVWFRCDDLMLSYDLSLMR